jgi:hypothetical protein
MCALPASRPRSPYRVVGGGLSANVLPQYATWRAVVERMQTYAPWFAGRHTEHAPYQLRYLARRAVQLGDASMAWMLLRAAFEASRRPLVEEPVKSAVTIAAALAARLMPAETFSRLAGRASGGSWWGRLALRVFGKERRKAGVLHPCPLCLCRASAKSGADLQRRGL